ncbi:hypothetical protein ACWENA_35505 [Streptomyces sp. NPDC004779]
MIVAQPVLETHRSDGFGLWPVAEPGPSGFLALDGTLTPAEVGAAVMYLAACNDIDPDGDRPPRPADPLASFLHGLLTFDTLFASGGLRVTDRATGVTFLPGCCDGIEDWRGWYRLVTGDGLLGFGHAPVTPTAERLGGTIRLTVDAERSDSPFIELTPPALRDLLAGAERDLTAFRVLADDWASVHLPAHRALVGTALSRVLDLPAQP